MRIADKIVIVIMGPQMKRKHKQHIVSSKVERKSPHLSQQSPVSSFPATGFSNYSKPPQSTILVYSWILCSKYDTRNLHRIKTKAKAGMESSTRNFKEVYNIENNENCI